MQLQLCDKNKNRRQITYGFSLERITGDCPIQYIVLFITIKQQYIV